MNRIAQAPKPTHLDGNGKPRIEATYDYRDETGTLLYQVVRYIPKDFRQRRPNVKGWLWNLQETRRVLYRLPELLQARPEKTVFVVEGEKDTDNLWDIEAVATTCAQGAGKWRAEYSEALRDRIVVILPDNDDPGRQHAQQVAAALHGIAREIRIVELPDLPPKADVSDWLAAGGDKIKLLELADKARPWKPSHAPTEPTKSEKGIGQKTESKKSQATELVELAESKLNLFHTPSDDEPFAAVGLSGAVQVWPVRGKALKRWLANFYFNAYERAASAEAVNAAQNILEGRALFDSPEEPVYVRCAPGQGGVIYLDLGNKKWDAIAVGPTGWEVVPSSPVKFRHPRGLLPLPLPVKDGHLSELRDFVNLDSEESWQLFVGWLLAAFRPCGPYPVLGLFGEQGSAKSTTARVARELTDPNKTPLRSEPRDGRDLAIAANNSWVIALDNLSHLSSWLSDCLCRLATGGGFATRELYTDAEEMIFDATRPVILTSIEEITTRGDLLERSIILHLPDIPEEKRRTEAEFWADFDRARAGILGALLDIVAAGLKNLPTVKLPRLPRMADFALWVTACEPALGWETGSFLRAYAGNVADVNELALESSPVAGPVRQFAEARRIWEGTATELLTELARLAGEEITRSRDWPKKPNTLSGKLKRLAPHLRKAGVGIDFGRGRNRRTIHLQVAAIGSSPSSPSSRPQAIQDFRGDDPGVW